MIINWLINTSTFILPNILGVIASEHQDAWIGFHGAIIGGIITLAGVAWTIHNQ